MNYQESLEYISSVNWKGSVPGLERIRKLMHLLGDPQKHLRFIHIGGTNGKGSTAAFLSNVLRCAGYKTGLYVSPYVESFTERMQINNAYISEEELAQITSYIRPFADSMEDSPTEFELNTAISLVYFYRNKCDIVVFEVGMGGEFDATNVIDSPELVILTAISLDHMEYLGDTLKKIASTKAGIIKTGSSVVLYRQGEEVTQVIRERCQREGAALYIGEPQNLVCTESDIDHQTFADEQGTYTIGLAAPYQKYNLATVLKAVAVLKEKGYAISQESLQRGLRETRWPGRFEILQRTPLFLVDGAHNPQGMEAAVKSLQALFGDKKLILITGILADKDYGQMLDMLLPLAKAVLCVAPDSPRALSPESLLQEVNNRKNSLGFFSEAYEDTGTGIHRAIELAEPNDIICAIGSLYLISDIKSRFKTACGE